MKELLLVLEPWERPQPLMRSWCLWEILSSILHDVHLQVVMPEQQHREFVRIIYSRVIDGQKGLG